MRKSYSFLFLLVACAACGDAADDSPTSSSAISGNPVATMNAGGSGESAADADESEPAGRGASAPAPITAGSSSATTVAPVVPGTGAAASVGGVGGVTAGGTAAGTVGGGGGGVGFGAVSSGAAASPVGDGVAVPPTIAVPSTTMPPVAPSTSPQPTPQGGQLTAGAWDDNLNYTRFTQFRNDVAQMNGFGILPFTAQDFDAAHDKFSKPRTAHQQLDVALVIDTTGSMGDEIAYLQREFTDLSTSIESAYPGAEQRWAMVVYKDVGDTYVTRQYDFRTDLNALRTDLAMQSAGGGGDFPEAPDAAFAKLNQFQWRSGENVARLAFWVADAPHHNDKAAAFAEALRSTMSQDIHVYPVASSGINEFTELTMRSSAQLTGGRYLFLTNDSGIGGAHKEPSIPCYFVTRLDQAILRMVDIEMSGMYREPIKEQIIRTGGNPKDGACQLEWGGEVEIF